MRIIKNPYDIEYNLAFSFFVEKNETVKGIIGNTQGVNKAKNPPKRPRIKILNLLEKLSLFSVTYSFSKSSELPKLSFKSLTIEE